MCCNCLNDMESKCPHKNIIIDGYGYFCLDCNREISRDEYKEIKNNSD